MPAPVESVTARDAFVITKSDATVFTTPAEAVYVGGAGDVAVRTIRQTVITFSGMAAGTVLPVRCDMVMSTNTTATNLVGLIY